MMFRVLAILPLIIFHASQSFAYDCGPCPPILTISMNGVYDDENAKFHDFVRRVMPVPPATLDPFNDGPHEWCSSRPGEYGDALAIQIEIFKLINPCHKVIVTGHSMGSIAAYSASSAADCAVMAQPPRCNRMGTNFCDSQRAICNAEDHGLRCHPGMIDTDIHSPYGKDISDPRVCFDQKQVERRLRECVRYVRPHCQADEEYEPIDCSVEQKHSQCPRKVTIQTCEGSSKTIEVPCKDSGYILDHAEEIGLELPYASRAGADSAAAAILIEGCLDQSEQTFLDEDAMRSGFALLDVARACGDSVIYACDGEKALLDFWNAYPPNRC